MGDYFAEKLERLPHVKEVRHQGLLVGVEFDDTISGVDVKHGCLTESFYYSNWCTCYSYGAATYRIRRRTVRHGICNH